MWPALTCAGAAASAGSKLRVRRLGMCSFAFLKYWLILFDMQRRNQVLSPVGVIESICALVYLFASTIFGRQTSWLHNQTLKKNAEIFRR